MRHLSVPGMLWWRRLRALPSAVLTIAATTAVVAGLVVAAPRVLERVSDDDLRASVADAEPRQRNITARLSSRLGAGNSTAPFEFVEARGERLLEDEVPPSIAALVGSHHIVVDSPPFQVTSFPEGVEGPFPTTIVFRHQEDIADELTVIRGRLPEERDDLPALEGHECPEDRFDVADFEPDPDVDCFLGHLPVFEIVVSEDTARDMMVDAGSELLLRPAGGDPRWFGASSFQLRQQMQLVVSGVVELTDEELPYWAGDTSLHRPRITENADFRLVFATGLMRPDRYRQMLRAVPFVHFDYEWRYLVDPERLEAEDAAELASDLAKLAPDDVEIITQLPDLIGEHLDQRALTVSLLSIVVASTVTAGLAAVALVSGLVALRQRPGTVLLRNRGASRTQLLAAALAQAAVVVAPVAVGAWIAAALAVADTASGAATSGVLLVGLAAVAVVVVTMTPDIVAHLGHLQPGGRPRSGRSPRRVVAELAMGAAALGAVVLLRRRGQIDSTSPARDVDVLLAVAPALIGLAAGVVALRAIGPVIGLVDRLAVARRGLVTHVSMRRAASQPGSVRVATVVIAIALGVAAFAAIVDDSVAAGRERHSWHVVGADIRIEGHARGVPLPAGVDFDAVTGQGPWTLASEYLDATVIGVLRAPAVHVIALDVDAHGEVFGGPGGADLGRLAAAPAEPGRPIAALVSTTWSGEAPPAPGTTFALDLGRVDPEVLVVGRLDAMASIPTGTPFVVVDRRALAAYDPDVLVPATTLLMRGDHPDADELRALLAETASTARVVDRRAELRRLTDEPYGRFVGATLRVVGVTAVALAGLAAVAAFALTAAARGRDVQLLRTMGLDRRGTTAIAVLEQLPLLVAAVVSGAAIGVGAAHLLSPALELDAFTGGDLATRLVVDPGVVALSAAAVVATLAVATVAFVIWTRRRSAVTVLRVGDT